MFTCKAKGRTNGLSPGPHQIGEGEQFVKAQFDHH
jgi:hypothetical protein